MKKICDISQLQRFSLGRSHDKFNNISKSMCEKLYTESDFVIMKHIKDFLDMRDLNYHFFQDCHILWLFVFIIAARVKNRFMWHIVSYY